MASLIWFIKTEEAGIWNRDKWKEKKAWQQHGLYLWQNVKEKQSNYRPWQALRVPGGWGSQILRQSAHEIGKVVSPTHRPPLPQGNIFVLISIRGWVDSRAAGRIMSMKNSSDSIGNQSRDLPVCSAVPQPLHTACPLSVVGRSNMLKYCFGREKGINYNWSFPIDDRNYKMTPQYLYVRRWCRNLSPFSCFCYKWRRKKRPLRTQNKLQIHWIHAFSHSINIPTCTCL
jgi:hypothetical protein